MRIHSFYRKEMRIKSVIRFLLSLVILIGLSITRINCNNINLSYAINIFILINISVFSFYFYDLLMAFWYFDFFPEGVGCDIEYAYNYKEAKITQIILASILYTLLTYVAKNKVGCELFISLVISNIFVLFIDFIKCSIEVVLFWLLLIILSLVFIYISMDFKLVFMGLIVCVPLKIIEHIKYY